MKETRDISTPEIGYFLIRLVKGGPFVPALICLPCPMLIDRGEFEIHPDDWGCPTRPEFRRLEAYIDGVETDVMRVWTSGHPASRKEWEYQTELAKWCRKHEPHEPLANPWKPMDLEDSPPIFRKAAT